MEKKQFPKWISHSCTYPITIELAHNMWKNRLPESRWWKWEIPYNFKNKGNGAIRRELCMWVCTCVFLRVCVSVHACMCLCMMNWFLKNFSVVWKFEKEHIISFDQIYPHYLPSNSSSLHSPTNFLYSLIHCVYLVWLFGHKYRTSYIGAWLGSQGPHSWRKLTPTPALMNYQ